MMTCQGPCSQVVQRIATWLQGEGQGTQVLLVPSTRDAHHAACFPQPAFAPTGLLRLLLHAILSLGPSSDSAGQS